jgi:hypothetical protein
MYKRTIVCILLFTCTVYLNACFYYKPVGAKEKLGKDENIKVKLKSGIEEELLFRGYLYNKQFYFLVYEDGNYNTFPVDNIKEIRLTPPVIIDKEKLKTETLISEILLNNNIGLKADSGYTYLGKYDYIRLYDSRCINLESIKEVRKSVGVIYEYNPLETGIEKNAFEVVSSKSIITKIKSFHVIESPLTLYGLDKKFQNVYIPVDDITQTGKKEISLGGVLLCLGVAAAVIYLLYLHMKATPINLGLW